ncbi:SOS response-associated peptidase [Wenzhouxiangella sp. XN201]|uniref:SOS response-associated peptidase n=1 Tax=Wenzhouxiangella sp. XN201 TaxID=2710755 RepID=UPI0013C6C2A5|nr:SOS response-associated peptidase [Wenzhouxiangella sp. XN201]NEZ04217.1 SOS response-associated peptidase [Wenzhouxiangella sp. XN201]
MCGRGGLNYSWKRVYSYLNILDEPPEGGQHRLNVAPSGRKGGEVSWTRIPSCRSHDGIRRLDPLVWPLVPHWAHGQLPKYATANCRSEPGQAFSTTVAKKPAFRTAWKRSQRCLVPFSWFYEWDQRTRPKQPYRVTPADGDLLVMAGLWDRSEAPEGDAIESFTLVTTEPNRLLRDIGHHRAPVILEPEDFETWLTGSPGEAERLLRPPADGTLMAEPVTKAVNNPGYEGEDLQP